MLPNLMPDMQNKTTKFCKKNLVYEKLRVNLFTLRETKGKFVYFKKIKSKFLYFKKIKRGSTFKKSF